MIAIGSVLLFYLPLDRYSKSYLCYLIVTDTKVRQTKATPAALAALAAATGTRLRTLVLQLQLPYLSDLVMTVAIESVKLDFCNILAVL